MRLLNVHTLKFGEFFESEIPKYYILSHRWGANELSYKEYRKAVNLSGPGYEKVIDFCSFVRDRVITGFDYSNSDHSEEFQSKEVRVEWVWIDSICIDKRSSAELSEAINAMYKWYEKAVQCIVHLADVKEPLSADEVAQSLNGGLWFTRGWTLQELLAPRMCVFVDSEWNILGHVCHRWSSRFPTCFCEQNSHGPPLHPIVSQITSIPTKHLKYNHRSGQYDSGHGKAPFWNITIAQRMSWASHRSTTRIEDKAYCLLGIFGINMPILYGEGPKAFIRLQEEIMKRTQDQSIFAWKPLRDADMSGFRLQSVLALSPAEFSTCSTIAKIPPGFAMDSSHELTNKGLRIEARAISIPWQKLEESGARLARPPKDVKGFNEVFLLPLNCYDTASSDYETLGYGKPVPCVLAITSVVTSANEELCRIHFRDDLAKQYAPLIEEEEIKQQFIVDAYGFFWNL